MLALRSEFRAIHFLPFIVEFLVLVAGKDPPKDRPSSGE